MLKKESQSHSYSAPIVYKAFAFLQEVAKAQGHLGVSDISRMLNINKSTVYGISQALLDLGALRQDMTTRKFRLGPTLIQLGNQSLAGLSLRTIARPFMEKLCQNIHETVFLGTFDEYGITIIEKVDSVEQLKISAPVGTRIPLFAGAAGKAFLAYLNPDVQKKLVLERALPKFTANSITNEKDYFIELAKVLEQGFATDFEEYIPGVNAICVPLLDNRKMIMAAIWIVGFMSTFTKEKMYQAIEEAKTASLEIYELLA